ncbi:MAG: DUF4175 domain-containing protein [Myxococcales bacterium]|nr:DUF4175 domain-containing protein [Myxococcales bacterium]
MAEDANRIRRFVASLVRRERALLLVRVVARAALLLLAVLALGVIASVTSMDRGVATLVVVVLAGVGSWIAVALPLLLEWASSGDGVRQARQVEALLPELRGRLITAVDASDDAAPGTSDALRELVVTRAARHIDGVEAAEVHDVRPSLTWAVAASLMWGVGLPLLLIASGGPRALAAFWAAGSSARAEVVGPDVEAPVDEARVGDLMIRYTYPDYTGLPPKEVPNSTGDVHGPPGTQVEVQARSAEVVEAVGLVAYDEALEATLDEEGRSLRGAFAIGKEEGTYSLLLYRDGEPRSSRDFRILPQDDLPPEVMLDAGEQDVLEVALDGRIGILWRARDDYGVRSVKLALDGKELDRVLERPERRKAEVSGALTRTPKELGLKPGDRAKLSVVAWDNDTVSGSKRGVSRQVEIVVLGAEGLDQRAEERRDELLGKMIPVLARFLTEPWPPGERAGELATWGEAVALRYQPFVDEVEAVWSGMASDTHDRAVAQRVIDTGRDLVRFTQVSFLPGSREVPSDDAFQATSELRDEAVVALEDGILAFHRMQRNAALRDIAEQADDLERMADQLEQLLSEDDADTQELLSKLDQLERMLDQLAAQAAKLEDGGLREFLNTRENEAQNLMEEIREAIAEGRLDEARELMERLSQLVQEMGQGIKDELSRREQQGEQQQDAANALKEELQALEQEQRDLQAEVQALREQDTSGSEEMAKLWEELERRAAEHSASAAAYGEGLESNGRAFYERERAAAGREQAEDLEAAIGVRDPRGAVGAVVTGRRAWGAAMRALDMERRSGRPIPGPGTTELLSLMRQLDQIQELLDKLQQSQQRSDPQTQQQSQQMQDRQRDLDNRLQQAQQDAKQLQQQFPVKPEGMQEALDEASERMDQAGQDLEGGQLMQAEGSQGVAAQRIRDAIESIEQAQEQARQQAQQMSGRRPEDGSRSDNDGQRDSNEMPNESLNLEIPGREEFRTPEEYRRALLEGMEGEVPEEYRAMKQRYYEELVHQ